jgi:hypothetical protein
MSTQAISAQAAGIESVKTYQGKRYGDMVQFLAKIGANDATLAPYVEHIVFKEGIDGEVNSGLLRMVRDRDERLGRESGPAPSCEIAMEYKQAVQDGDHGAIWKLRQYMETDDIPCGPDCILACEWSICQNVRTVTMPVKWVTDGVPGHAPFWQYFDKIDVQKQYKYRHEGVVYIVIGDSKAPGTRHWRRR